MAEIRKIGLLDGTAYQVGERLVSMDGTFTIESLYLQDIGLVSEFLVVRVYVEEKGSPFVDTFPFMP